MNINTLVQATANVVTIATVKEGDVYKRLVKEPYGDGYKLAIGVVTGVLNNGQDVAVSALEFESSYSDASAKLVTHATNSDVSLFPATPEEVQSELHRVRELAGRTLEIKQNEFFKAKAVLEQVDSVLSKVDSGQLTTAETVTGTAINASVVEA